MVVDQETGGKEYEKLPLDRSLRGDAGSGDSDRGDLPHGVPSVSCGIFADRLRLWLHAEVKEGGCHEDSCRQVAEVSQRYFEADLQNEGLTRFHH